VKLQRTVRRKHWLLVVALFLALQPLSLIAQPSSEKKALTLGGVGYSERLDKTLKELISYLNQQPDFKSFQIRKNPALLDYQNAVDFVSDATAVQMDIAFLTPMAFVKARKGKGGGKLVPVAVALMGDSSKNARFDYVGKIYYNPSRVDKSTLKLSDGGGKARLALIPGSGSGYFYPIAKLAELMKLKDAPTWKWVEDNFVYRQAQRHPEALDLFFDSDTNQRRVDIISVYEEEPKIFLRDEAKLAQVVKWLESQAKRIAPNDPKPEEVFRILEDCCRIADTARMPGDVLVVNTSSLMKGIEMSLRKALAGLNDQLKLDSPPTAVKELKNDLQQRNVQGFSTDSAMIDSSFRKLAEDYDNTLKATEQPAGFKMDAKSLVQNIAFDIRFRREADPQYVPKIAVVLSGGGASGVYQAGALVALSEKFRDFRNEHSSYFDDVFTKDNVRIHAYVGTSAGAINAVSALLALGDMSDERGDALSERLASMWKQENIGSWKILRAPAKSEAKAWPYYLYWAVNRGWAVVLILAGILQIYLFFKIASVIGTFLRPLSVRAIRIIAIVTWALSLLYLYFEPLFASIQIHLFALATVIVRREWGRSTRTALIRFVFAVLVGHSAFLLSAPYLPISFTEYQVTESVFWIGWLLLICDAICVLRHVRRWAGWTKTAEGRLLRSPLAPLVLKGIGFAVIALLAIVPLQILDLVLGHAALFDQQPLEAALIRSYGNLAGNPSVTDKRVLGEQIIRRVDSARVDLVITATDFTNYTDGVRPRELYFYQLGQGKKLSDLDQVENRFVQKWVSLRDRPDAVLDAILASGAVFPAFPPRLLKDLQLQAADGGPPHEASAYQLIDGGFLHNVPIQAAVEIGATHIIAIQVTPTPPDSEQHTGGDLKQAKLGESLVNAFGLLFERAQNSDLEATSRQRVFLLAPTSRQIGILDFDGHYGGFWNRLSTLNQFYETGQTDALAQTTDRDNRLSGFQRVSLGTLYRERPGQEEQVPGTIRSGR